MRTAHRSWYSIRLVVILCVWMLGAAPLAQAAEISNVKISEITEETATIEWKTDIPTDATINYGLDTNVGMARDPLFDKKEHSLTLENLKPSTTYYFRVVSADPEGNKSTTAGFVFTTKSSTDEVPPEVEAIKDPDQRVLAEEIIEKLDQVRDPSALTAIVDKVNQIAGDVLKPPAIVGAPKIVVDATEATFTWVTDRESGSMVYLSPDGEYDPAASEPYGIAQGNPNERVKKHVVNVIGLDPSTEYHFKISSEDDYRMRGETADDTFKTRALKALVQGVKITRIQEHSAVVSWNTGGVLAKGVVEFTNTRNKATKSAGDPVYAANHAVQLADLEFGTRYSVVITAVNEGGEETKSAPITFVTVRDVLAPQIAKVKNESTLFPGEDTKIQTLLAWETDEPATCQVFYTQGLIRDANGGGESLPPEPNPTTSHTQVVVGFAPATVYKFWMTCFDESKNEAQSEDYVLITPIKEKSIIDIILENFEGTFGWVKNIAQ
ncbi:MAG: fibronectin type III domain-containing protein [Candidatus Pacebacteria bacterium]|nr:fibronectin type III domain-containing protein [Candidatus Paceibacterota bacterium]